MGTQAASANLSVDIRAIVSNDMGNSTGTPTFLIGELITKSLTDGTSANQIDRVFSHRCRTLTSGNNSDIDVFDFAGEDAGAGAGNDALGQAVSLVEVVVLMVVNQATSVGNAVVGGEGSAAAFNAPFGGSDTATVTVRPGGLVLFVATVDPAYAVADSSNHLLRINALGGNITYDVHIFGRSA